MDRETVTGRKETGEMIMIVMRKGEKTGVIGI